MHSSTRLSLVLLSSAQFVHGGSVLEQQQQQTNAQNEGALTNAGVPATNRTIFTVIAFVCMGLLSLLLGSRFGGLKRSIIVKRKFVSMLVLSIHTTVLIFIALVTVMVAGQGLRTYRLCLAGIWLGRLRCRLRAIRSLVNAFYAMTIMNLLVSWTPLTLRILFLVERIHIVRAPFVRRKKDKIYLACLATIILAYLPAVINCYIDPVTNMDSSGLRCRFGIGGAASIPVLAVSVFVDLVLTSVFFYLLRPFAIFRGSYTVPPAVRYQPHENVPTAQNDPHETPAQRNIRTLLWKSIIGSLLIEIPMMANMIQSMITNGQELGMICLTVCMVELVWDVLVIHWLALGPSAQAEKDLERSLAASSQGPFTQLQPGAQSMRTGHEEASERVTIASREEAEDVRTSTSDSFRKATSRVESSAENILLAPQGDRRIQ